MTLAELNELVNDADVDEALVNLDDVCCSLDYYDETPEEDRWRTFTPSFHAFGVHFDNLSAIVELRQALVNRFDTEPDQLGYHW